MKAHEWTARQHDKWSRVFRYAVATLAARSSHLIEYAKPARKALHSGWDPRVQATTAY